jgi:hypothetical protein
MRSRFVSLGVTVAVVLLLPAAAQAGMPSVSFSDWAALRFETLSFFVLVLLLATAVVRWLWNILAADFPKLPRLTYGKSLASVILIGITLAVVLTMIAGSRELLTPGAWEKQDRLYKVAAQKAESTDTKEAPSKPSPLDARKAQLRRLYVSLSEYALNHGDKFPERDAARQIEQSLWEVPGTSGMRYLYVGGLPSKDTVRILAYEPEFFKGWRLVLTTNGVIALMRTEDVRGQLQREEKP